MNNNYKYYVFIAPVYGRVENEVIYVIKAQSEPEACRQAAYWCDLPVSWVVENFKFQYTAPCLTEQEEHFRITQKLLLNVGISMFILPS